METKLENNCSCKEKWTFGVVHREHKPCYLAPNGMDFTYARREALSRAIEVVEGKRKEAEDILDKSPQNFSAMGAYAIAGDILRALQKELEANN